MRSRDLSEHKVLLGVDVLTAARARVARLFDDFDHLYVALSGGKDSGVLFWLAYEEARKRGQDLHVLCVDLEGQYTLTMDFVRRCFSLPGVTGHWVCLPLNLRNSVSQHQPFWLCWNPDVQDQWIRELPPHPAVVSDEKFFPFFRRGMEFEEFVPEYGQWTADREGRTACLIAIRSDESLNRYRTVKSEVKETWEGLSWTTRLSDTLYNAFPIYDWHTEDVWAANGRFEWDYNRVYDLMHLARVPLSKMRLCQPYGDDQRQGLWLYKILEPDTWAKVVARVQGANFGQRHSTKKTLGHIKVILPEGHTWKSYSRFMLSTMPPPLARHYKAKIDRFVWWYREKEGIDPLPDAADPKLEASRKAGSWRRIAKVLVKNDYWCKGLGFAQTRKERDRQLALALEFMLKEGTP